MSHFVKAIIQTRAAIMPTRGAIIRSSTAIIQTCVVLAAIIFTIPGSAACDCPGKRTVQDELAASSAVFSGKIVEMHWFDKESEHFGGKRRVKSIIIVTLQVINTWKGNVSQRVEVETGDPELDNCGVDFKKDEEYLVYAVQKKNRLETDVCSRTKLLSTATEDIHSLGPK